MAKMNDALDTMLLLGAMEADANALQLASGALIHRTMPVSMPQIAADVKSHFTTSSVLNAGGPDEYARIKGAADLIRAEYVGDDIELDDFDVLDIIESARRELWRMNNKGGK